MKKEARELVILLGYVGLDRIGDWGVIGWLGFGLDWIGLDWLTSAHGIRRRGDGHSAGDECPFYFNALWGVSLSTPLGTAGCSLRDSLMTPLRYFASWMSWIWVGEPGM